MFPKHTHGPNIYRIIWGKSLEMGHVDYFLTLTYFALLSAFLIVDDQYAK